MSANRYTAAMLAELVGVHVSRIRSWQRRGWIVPAAHTHRLAYFDFQELTVARQLVELHRLGASPQLIAKKLAEIERRFPDVMRPLAELTLLLDGRTLLVRRGTDLVEPGGQLRIDFDALDREEEDESPATIPSPAIFLSRKLPQSPEQAAPTQLAAWAAELDEAGDLRGAAEMYRAALAAGGPQPELCFQLAEVLYRAGDLGAARERYFAALELDEDYVEARVNLGCVLLDLGERELAAGAFAGALRSHDAYADAHYHLARTLDELGRQDEALTHWRRFAELSPDNPWADEARQRLQE
ncbi:MAG TPA: tetratricopeptide repeat protein [Pirellulaceae bacterium]|nr:tetratricopeptide repeat protein [Pirellulaceae bacterium]